jgi:hypothetical protein
LQPLVEELKRLFEKFLVKILDFKRLNCTELVPIAQLNGVKSLCNLFDALATPENGVDPYDQENYVRMIEFWFQCAIGTSSVQFNLLKSNILTRNFSNSRFNSSTNGCKMIEKKM